LRNWSVGGTIMRLREIDTVQTFLLDRATSGMIDILFIFVYLALLLSISPQLMLVVLTALPFQFAVFFGFGPSLRRRLQSQFDASSLYQSRVIEAIGGIQTVKALSAEGLVSKSIQSRVESYLHQDYRVNSLAIWNEKLIFLIDRLLTIAILLLGARLVSGGVLTLGELVAFFLLAEKIAGPISQSSGLWEAWQNLRLSRRRLNDIIAQPVETGAGSPDLPTALSPQVSLLHIGFGYGETQVVDNLSFDFPPYALSMIVGPSGIGKSTIGRIMAGLERPSDGVVSIGGHPIDRYAPSSVRRRIVYVPQEPNLFRGTITENFHLIDQRLDPVAIWDALRLADADGFVREMSGQLDTWIDERGGTISGGQRQRLALARALAIRPDVLILDEPTSSLDAASEARIAATLAVLAERMTIIIITHRPESFSYPAATLVLSSGTPPALADRGAK
jgi:subfamily B ATP-binding cassette protein HlyB/CyaB